MLYNSEYINFKEILTDNDKIKLFDLSQKYSLNKFKKIFN